MATDIRQSRYGFRPVKVTHDDVIDLINNEKLIPGLAYNITDPSTSDESVTIYAIDEKNLDSTGYWNKFIPDWDMIGPTTSMVVDYSQVGTFSGIQPTQNKGTYRSIRTIIPIAPFITIQIQGTISYQPVVGETVFLATNTGVVKSEGIVAYPIDMVTKKLIVAVTSNNSWKGGGKVVFQSGSEYNVSGGILFQDDLYVDKITNLGILKKYSSNATDEINMSIYQLDKRTNFFLTDMPHLPIAFQKVIVNDINGFGDGGKWGGLVLSQPFRHPSTIGTGANGIINRIVELSNGKFIIGGSFTSYNGTNAKGICRLNSNGSIDTSFVSPFNSLTGTVTVNTITVDEDNSKIYVGGSFTIGANNNPSNKNILRTNLNGVIDNTFTTNLNNDVNTIVLDNNKIVIGGKFTKYDTIDRNRIARLNNNGTLDTTFVPIGTGTNQGFNSDVNTIVLYDGSYICGGGFSSYGGVTRRGIAILSSVNATISINAPTIDNGAVNTILLSVDDTGNGKMYIGGSFTKILGNTQGSISVFRIENNQDMLSPINIIYEGFPQLNTRNGGFNSAVKILAFSDDDKNFIVVGGAFTKYNQGDFTYNRNRICRINIDGNLDRSYNTGTGASAAVNDLVVVKENNSTAIVGAFQSFNEVLVGRITIVSIVPLNHLNSYKAGDIVTDYLDGSGYYHYQKIPKMFTLNSTNDFDLLQQDTMMQITSLKVFNNSVLIYQNIITQDLDRTGLAQLITTGILSSGVTVTYVENITSVNPISKLSFSSNPSQFVVELTTTNYHESIKPSSSIYNWIRLPRKVGFGYIQKSHNVGYDIKHNVFTYCSDSDLGNIIKTTDSDEICIFEFPWGNKNWKNCQFENISLSISDPNFCFVVDVKAYSGSSIILDDDDTYEVDNYSCGLVRGIIGHASYVKLKADPFFDGFSTNDRGTSFLADFNIGDSIKLIIPPGKTYRYCELDSNKSSFKDYMILSETETDNMIIDFNREFKQSDIVYNMSYLGEINIIFEIYLNYDPLGLYLTDYYIKSFVNWNVEWDSLLQKWVDIDYRQTSTIFKLSKTFFIEEVRDFEPIKLPIRPFRETINTDVDELIRNDFILWFSPSPENPFIPWIKGGLNYNHTIGNMYESYILGLRYNAYSERLSTESYILPISEDFAEFKLMNVEYTGQYSNSFSVGIQDRFNCLKSSGFDDDLYLIFDKATTIDLFAPSQMEIEGYEADNYVSITIKVNNIPYVYGESINKFDRISVTSSSASNVVLKIKSFGSLTIDE
jgi:hypothetical protein